jgi:hypothetical protein
MAVVAGAIQKIVVTNVPDIPEGGTVDDLEYDAVVYVADPGVTPFPGLPILANQGPDTTMVAILGASDSDRHTLASTGELP